MIRKLLSSLLRGMLVVGFVGFFDSVLAMEAKQDALAEHEKLKSSIHVLPAEVVGHVFHFMNLKDQVKARRVCHLWKGTIDGDQALTSNILRAFIAGKTNPDDFVHTQSHSFGHEDWPLLVSALLIQGDPLTFAHLRSASIEAVQSSQGLQDKLEGIVQRTEFCHEAFFKLIEDSANHPQLKKNLAARSLLASYSDDLQPQPSTSPATENKHLVFLNSIGEALSNHYKSLSQLRDQIEEDEESELEDQSGEKVRFQMKQPLWVCYFPEKELWVHQSNFFSHISDAAFLADLDELERFNVTFLTFFPEESRDHTFTFKNIVRYFRYVCLMKQHLERELSFLLKFKDETPYKLPLVDAYTRNERYQEALEILEPLLKENEKRGRLIELYSEALLAIPYDAARFLRAEQLLNAFLPGIQKEKRSKKFLALKVCLGLFTKQNEKEFIQVVNQENSHFVLKLSPILSNLGFATLSQETKLIILGKVKEYLGQYGTKQYKEAIIKSPQALEPVMKLVVLDHDSFFREVCAIDPTGVALKEYEELYQFLENTFKKDKQDEKRG